MLKDFFALAWSNFKHRGMRSWLTMLGIFIGIAAVVSLISLGQGLEQAITGQFSSLSNDVLIVENMGAGFGPPGSTAIKKLTLKDQRLIESISGIEKVIPRIIRVANVKYNENVEFIFLGSLPEKDEHVEYIYNTFSLKIGEGTLLKAKDNGKVLLGSSIAEEEEFGKRIRSGSTLLIQGKKFKVNGILQETGSFQFNNAIFMTEADMKKIFHIENEIDFIVVQVKSAEETESIAAEIERRLRKDRDEKIGEEDFSVQTPLQTIGAVSALLTAINIVVSGIAALSLLIGGIGIANTMYTSVLERTKEIGIMKAIGAQNKDITSIFLIESASLGLAGGIIGAILGIGLAFAVASIANTASGFTLLQVNFSLPLILSALTFSSLLGICAGLFPALQAARLKPVEALRK